MRRFAVVHHRFQEWVPALREAEPRLEIQGWHPRELSEGIPPWLESAEGLFTWMPPSGLLGRMARLVWIQNAGAGVDHLVRHPEIPESVALTRADGRFGEWMARYVLGHLLGEVQRIEACRAAQRESRWDPRLRPEDLSGARGVVLGFGRIGRTLGRAFAVLGMEVHGIVRKPRPDPEFPLHGVTDLPALLPGARVLVNCAPLTDETRGILGAGLLALDLRELTLFNLGRGAHLDLEALRAALDAGRLGRAVLDVFPEEPLPREHWAWRHPGIVITPHHAGPSTPSAMMDDLRENLARFAEGQALVEVVDRRRGY